MRANQRGFSLLEVLAAFVILALVGTQLFRLFSGALGNATLADEYSRATLYAESRLAAVSVEAPLKESTLQGNSDDGLYAWTAVIAPYTTPGSTADLESAAAAMPVSLWKLAVTVAWPGTPGNERPRIHRARDQGMKRGY
jgi:general secretion pathway protein I